MGIGFTVYREVQVGIGIGIFYFSDRKHTNRVNMIFDKIIRCLDQWMTV